MKIQVVTDPNLNAISITPGEKDLFDGEIFLNDFSDVFTYEKATPGLSLSPEKAFLLLEKGFISKSDFLGDPTKVLLEGKVADKAKIIIKKVRIGRNTLDNVEATVVKDLKSPIRLGDTVLEKIGKFTVNKEKNLLIFE